MKILGIETSCDETAASVVEDGTHILSNVIVSQVDIHKAYGGVVPEIAARSHIEAILPVVRKALEEASFPSSHNPKNQMRRETGNTRRFEPVSPSHDELSDSLSKIDTIAVTHTPGLNGSLLIGTLTARTLALMSNKPLYPTHHIKSHIYANWLDRKHLPEFPLIALVVSGGHTQLIHMKNHNDFEIIGTTRDDAVGEAFDKVAKILGLPYPGGPSIALAAEKSKLGNLRNLFRADSRQLRQSQVQASRLSGLSGPIEPGPDRSVVDSTSCKETNCESYPNLDFFVYKLPIPRVSGLDFSFSGLKTAVLRAVQKAVDVPISTPSTSLPVLLTDWQKNNFAASFQHTAVEILVEKLAQAVEIYQPKSILLAGGVSANQLLRKKVNEKFVKTPVYCPEFAFCGDNAAMVAAAAYFDLKSGQKPTNPLELEVNPTSNIH